MGGLPYAGSVNEVNQTTATGMSIVTSIAERMIKARSANFAWAYGKLGEMFLSMMSQFVRQERAYMVEARGGDAQTMLLSPSDFQGDWAVTIDVMEESMMRQERRAEAQALVQVAAGIAPIAAQLNAPLNMRAFVELALDAYDIQDKERYFLPAAPPQLAPPPPGQGAGGTAPTPGGNGAGVTNPQLAAGPSSPSAEGGISQSPQAMMSRLMSMRGVQQ